MKICFIGLGSIGQRHLRNLAVVLERRGLPYQIDAVRSSDKPLDESVSRYICKSFYSIGEADDDYDVTFITNPTSMHYDAAKQMINKTRHMFVEKPVFDSCDYDLSIFDKDNIYYVACPLRYTKVIRTLKEWQESKKVFAARVICSTYLPHWRPGVDYRTTYSAQKALGGGVSIDLIHEIDYISYLFGLPLNVHSIKGKYSNLEIDSDDLSLYMMKYADKLVSVHLDYFGRASKREIEIFTDEDTIAGDLINQKITFLKEGRTLDFAEDRDDYQIREIEHFIDIVLNGSKNDNDINYANQILRIAKDGL